MEKKKEPNLKEQVLHFQKTGEGIGNLNSQLALQIYRYPRIKLGWGHDSCCEFYLYTFPKLMRIIKNYQDKGPPFDHYLHCVLRWQLLTYNRRRKRERWYWTCAREVEFWDTREEECADSAPDSSEMRVSERVSRVLQLSPDNLICNAVERRQFLMYALKKGRSLSEQNLQELVTLTGCELTWLQEVKNRLCRSLEPREQRLEMLCKRKRGAFFAVRSLEKQLQSEPCPEKKEQLNCLLMQKRLVVSRAAQAIARLHLHPTHRVIAEVTGHPKGTVDADIAAIKRRLVKVFLN